jgi:hypothetical protein
MSSVLAEQTADSPIMNEEKLALEKAIGGNQINAANRSKFKKIVHIYGDSIARGYGYGAFEIDKTFNSIQGIAQYYLYDQGISQQEVFFRYAYSQSPQVMADDLLNGVIRQGDVVLFEDAGPHENNIQDRENSINKIISVFYGKGIRLIFTTMFEYLPPPRILIHIMTRQSLMVEA